MATFRLRRTDYGAILREGTISGGFTLKLASDATITVGTPATTDDTQAKTVTTGDGKARLVS